MAGATTFASNWQFSSGSIGTNAFPGFSTRVFQINFLKARPFFLRKKNKVTGLQIKPCDLKGRKCFPQCYCGSERQRERKTEEPTWICWAATSRRRVQPALEKQIRLADAAVLLHLNPSGCSCTQDSVIHGPFISVSSAHIQKPGYKYSSLFWSHCLWETIWQFDKQWRGFSIFLFSGLRHFSLLMFRNFINSLNVMSRLLMCRKFRWIYMWKRRKRFVCFLSVREASDWF